MLVFDWSCNRNDRQAKLLNWIHLESTQFWIPNCLLSSKTHHHVEINTESYTTFIWSSENPIVSERPANLLANVGTLEAVCQNVWMEIVLKLVTMSLVSAAQLKIYHMVVSGWVWILVYIHVYRGILWTAACLGLAVTKGGPKPWWIAVVSGCDVGDGDFGSFSPTLCASAGLVPVWHCSWMTCCACKREVVVKPCSDTGVKTIQITRFTVTCFFKHFSTCSVLLLMPKLQVNNLQCSCFISALAKHNLMLAFADLHESTRILCFDDSWTCWSF